MPCNGVRPPEAGGDVSPDVVRPRDVGLHAMEIYFPPYFVDQAELEQFDGVSTGKYTIGLGQKAMGFTGDHEDVNSMSLTVVHNLLEKHSVEAADIGWMGVGTETILDKSKSTKSVLMSVLAESGNSDVEGVDFKNACYGGTAALFSAIDWVESSSWDGRFALVVAADNAVYAKGAARPTGGAGAIAMLVGPNAPLALERGTRSSHVEHAFDFFKPDLQSEYPSVDGKLSIQCYFNALDTCYRTFKRKFRARQKSTSSDCCEFNLDAADAFVFHTPFCKIVQKSLGRLALNDFLQDSESSVKSRYADLEPFRDIKLEESYLDKNLEKALLKSSRELFEQKTEPSLFLAKLVGNMYTPSVYGGLVSYLLDKTPTELTNCRVVMFSYGSGLASSMYSLKVTEDGSVGSPLDKLLRGIRDVPEKLDGRLKISPSRFTEILQRREDNYHTAPFTPESAPTDLAPGAYYLEGIDAMRRRRYARRAPLVT